MATLGKLANAKVSEVMTQHVISLTASDTIQEAASVMLEHGFSTVPVVNTNNKCIGILSRSDLTELLLQQDDELSRLLDTDRLSLEWFNRTMETTDSRSVNELMSDNVSLVKENTSLPDACREMVRNRVHHLPVVNRDDKVVGIISTFDIVNAVANTEGE